MVVAQVRDTHLSQLLEERVTILYLVQLLAQAAGADAVVAILQRRELMAVPAAAAHAVKRQEAEILQAQFRRKETMAEVRLTALQITGLAEAVAHLPLDRMEHQLLVAMAALARLRQYLGLL